MTDRASTVQRFFADAVRDHQSARSSGADFLPGARVARVKASALGPEVPASVHEAFGYYYARVEQADWGSVGVFRTAVDGRDAYAVRVTTDGDDGWLELFDADGAPLGAARTYVETVVFEPRDAARARVDDNSFPAGLAPPARG